MLGTESSRVPSAARVFERARLEGTRSEQAVGARQEDRTATAGSRRSTTSRTTSGSSGWARRMAGGSKGGAAACQASSSGFSLDPDRGGRNSRWMAAEYQKQIACENAKRIRGKNPNLHRRDRFGNRICKPAYGTQGAQGQAVPVLAGAPAGRSSIRTSASTKPRPSCFARVSALDDSMAPILQADHGQSIPAIALADSKARDFVVRRSDGQALSADGFDGPVDSRLQLGKQRGNRDRTIDSKSFYMNNL